jgi:hypothetical protein
LQIGGAGQPQLSRRRGEIATAVPFLVWLTFLAVVFSKARKNRRQSAVAEPSAPRGWPVAVAGAGWAFLHRLPHFAAPNPLLARIRDRWSDGWLNAPADGEIG